MTIYTWVGGWEKNELWLTQIWGPDLVSLECNLDFVPHTVRMSSWMLSCLSLTHFLTMQDDKLSKGFWRKLKRFILCFWKWFLKLIVSHSLGLQLWSLSLLWLLLVNCNLVKAYFSVCLCKKALIRVRLSHFPFFETAYSMYGWRLWFFWTSAEEFSEEQWLEPGMLALFIALTLC